MAERSFVSVTYTYAIENESWKHREDTIHRDIFQQKWFVSIVSSDDESKNAGGEYFISPSIICDRWSGERRETMGIMAKERTIAFF